MAIFKGAGVAIVTPMNEDGSVNYEKFGELIEFQIANGTDAIIVCGTTGESSTLTHEEHLDTIKYCVDKVAKRIPVVAGTGSNCTETAVYLSQEAEKYGVDGILLVSPYYNKATQKGLYRHFKTVADSVKVPAILYNVPSRTGCNILPETVVKLCKDVENIVGVKEASGNISQIAHLAAIGHPIIGDYKYGDFKINEAYKKKYGLKTQLLHAYQLCFPDVELVKNLPNRQIIAPVPDLFKKICIDKGVNNNGCMEFKRSSGFDL